MTTTTASPAAAEAAPAPRRRPPTGGFTLVELMIAASLSSVVLLGVLSTFLFLGRSGANMNNYTEMEAEARVSLENFAQDVRQASSITWNSTEDVTLVVNGTSIRYRYVAAAGTFERIEAGTTDVLISGIIPGSFTFKAFKIDTTEITSFSDLAAAGRMTKQLQISLEASRTDQTVTTATNTVLSARFVLRNKRVTT